MQRSLHLPLVTRLLFGAAVAWSATVHAQSTMSPEETAVRAAYARLAFATEADPLITSAFHLNGPNTPFRQHDPSITDADPSQAQLHIVLSGFKVGPMSDFGNGTLKFADFASAPQTRLYIGPRHPGWQEPSGQVQQLTAVARWTSTPPENAGMLLPASTYGTDGDPTVKGARRYASYTATFTLAGETRSARATVLFDERGHAAIVDEMVGAPLIPFLYGSVYPHVLLEVPTIRKQPLVADWLARHTLATSGCKADQQHECVDPAAGVVGIHPVDMERSLVSPPARTPLAPIAPGTLYTSPLHAPPSASTSPSSKTKTAGGGAQQCSDYNFAAPPLSAVYSGVEEHTSGSHRMYTASGGACVYWSANGPLCGVTAQAWIAPTIADTGNAWSSWVVPVNHFTHVDDNPPNFAVGTGTIGASLGDTGQVKSCPIGVCNINLGSYFNYAAPVIWTATKIATIICAAEPDPSYAPSGGYSGDPGDGGGENPCTIDSDDNNCQSEQGKPHAPAQTPPSI